MSWQILLKNNQNSLFPALINSDVVSTFSNRYHKNMSLNYGDTGVSLNNRRDFLESLGINYHYLVCAKQTHGTNVKYVDKKDIGKGALSYSTAIDNTDALATDKKNVPLAVFTADCLSVFLYDPKTPAIGLIHAGWRSTKENITAKTIQLMQQQFNTQTYSLYAGFGPAIQECCYEVTAEFSKFFASDLFEKERRYYINLVGANKRQLLDLGIKETNIFDSKICTSCQNENFFSYRKEGKSCGRMMSVMMLNDSFKR